MKKKTLFAFLFAVVFSLCAYSQKTTLTVLDYIDATAPGYAEVQSIWQKFMIDNPDIEIVKEDGTVEVINKTFKSTMEDVKDKVQDTAADLKDKFKGKGKEEGKEDTAYQYTVKFEDIEEDKPEEEPKEEK